MTSLLRCIRGWAFFLIITGIAAQTSFIFVNRDALAHRPFEEDTFFHMAVTRNMAMGKGITIDGIEPTSGAQPGNFLYVLAHLAAHGDKWEALRWARALNVLESILAACLLYTIVRMILSRESRDISFSYAALTAGLWLSSFQVFRTNLNGYETALAAVVLLACTAVYLRVWRAPPLKQKGIGIDFVLGVLFGLAVLTRVDHGFLAASAAVSFLIFAPEPVALRWRRVVIWASVAALITTPWWVFNYRLSGSIMPISGKASSFQMVIHGYGMSVRNCLLRTTEAVLSINTLGFYSPYSWGENLIWISILCIFTILLLILFRRWKPLAELRLGRIELRPFYFLAAFSVILCTYYVFAHGSWWFMKRYIHPIRTSAYIFSAFFVLALSGLLRGLTRVSPQLALSVVAGTQLLICVGSTVAIYNKTDSNNMMQVIPFLAEHCQDGRIGAFQSGSFGYFLDNVVNLDGKNNAAALHAVTNRTVVEYMLEKDLKYVTDWPQHIAAYCDFKQFQSYYEPIGTVGSSTIYQRRSTVP
jgi:hypothetical protein